MNAPSRNQSLGIIKCGEMPKLHILNGLKLVPHFVKKCLKYKCWKSFLKHILHLLLLPLGGTNCGVPLGVQTGVCLWGYKLGCAFGGTNWGVSLGGANWGVHRMPDVYLMRSHYLFIVCCIATLSGDV